MVKHRRTDWGYPDNDLFHATTDIGLNAAVGFNGGPKDLSDYAEGYFAGGFAIIGAAERREEAIDILIYPAAFAFRHAIELYTKHILSRLRELNGGRGHDYQPTHKLMDNWTNAMAELKVAQLGEVPADQMAIAEQFISDFLEVDPWGEAFRYPTNKKGEVTLKDVSLFNAGVLRDGMERMHEILRDLADYLDVLVEEHAESRHDNV
jgi:hypothetical protein